jgi:Ca2+-binding RTX toxin-like protein
MTLRVFRPTGITHQYQVISDGGKLRTIPASSGLHTFPTQRSVESGDIIGIRAMGGDCASDTGNAADTYDAWFGFATPVGAMFTYIPFPPGRIWDVSAQLEPDCDKDGLGDETQDTNLSTCPAGTSPTGPITGPGGAPVTCKGKPATIAGTNGNDVRTGSQGRDVIVGLGGSDTLSGLGGNDVICGGAGKNPQRPGAGDLLKGGKGNDALYGQKGNDRLKGDRGADLCNGGKGKDTAGKCEVEKSI